MSSAIGPGLLGTGTPSLKEYNLTVTGVSWTTTVAKGIPYQTEQGTWRLKFNIEGSTTSATRSNYFVTVAGINALERPALTAYARPDLGIPIPSAAMCYTANMFIYHTSATTTFYSVSGDIELTAKPTWAD